MVNQDLSYINENIERVIQRAYALCLWVSRRARLSFKGEFDKIDKCDIMIRKCLKLLMESVKDVKEDDLI